MQIRLHALYGQNRTLIIVVSILFVLAIGSNATLTTMGVVSMFKLSQYGTAIIPGTPFCLFAIPEKFYAYSIPLLFFEFVLVCLVAYKVFDHCRSTPDKTWTIRKVVKIMLRDSVLSFVAVDIICSANVLVWKYREYNFFNLVLNWGGLLPSIIASRILINMRKAGREPEPVSSPSKLSTLRIGFDSQGMDEESAIYAGRAIKRLWS
ncbi:hypothetical protein BDQ12DRAFT_694192, partial [Crucibulum laeve]